MLIVARYFLPWIILDFVSIWILPVLVGKYQFIFNLFFLPPFYLLSIFDPLNFPNMQVVKFFHMINLLN